MDDPQDNISAAKNPRSGAPYPVPKTLDAFPDARDARAKTKMWGGKLRKRWKDTKNGRIYEWDSKSGAVEVYDRMGRHLGEFDPVTGVQTKDADPTRKVEP